jgi:hypothetical protein
MSQCTGKGLTAQAVEEAMEQHEGLIQAFIRRRQAGSDCGTRSGAMTRGEGRACLLTPGWLSAARSISGPRN